jgi:hypothetical protein
MTRAFEDINDEDHIREQKRTHQWFWITVTYTDGTGRPRYRTIIPIEKRSGRVGLAEQPAMVRRRRLGRWHPVGAAAEQFTHRLPPNGVLNKMFPNFFSADYRMFPTFFPPPYKRWRETPPS